MDIDKLNDWIEYRKELKRRIALTKELKRVMRNEMIIKTIAGILAGILIALEIINLLRSLQKL